MLCKIIDAIHLLYMLQNNSVRQITDVGYVYLIEYTCISRMSLFL